MESVLLTVDLESDIATENEGMMCAMCAVLRPNDRLNVSSTRESWVSDGEGGDQRLGSTTADGAFCLDRRQCKCPPEVS